MRWSQRTKLLTDGRDKFLCMCGCNTEINITYYHTYYGVRDYLPGHTPKHIPKRKNKKRPLLLSEGRVKYYCHCGCNQEICFKKEYIKKGYPNYIESHNNGRHDKSTNIYWLGKSRSEETKLKISFSRIGKKHTESTRIKIAKSHSGVKRPDEYIQKISGKNSPMWKGGTSFEPYCPKFNELLKEKIRNQYNRVCYVCGNHESLNSYNGIYRKLSVHHIDMDKGQGCNGHKWKLVPLCAKCHSKIHRHAFELL